MKSLQSVEIYFSKSKKGINGDVGHTLKASSFCNSVNFLQKTGLKLVDFMLPYEIFHWSKSNGGPSLLRCRLWPNLINVWGCFLVPQVWGWTSHPLPGIYWVRSRATYHCGFIYRFLIPWTRLISFSIIIPRVLVAIKEFSALLYQGDRPFATVPRWLRLKSACFVRSERSAVLSLAERDGHCDIPSSYSLDPSVVRLSVHSSKSHWTFGDTCARHLSFPSFNATERFIFILKVVLIINIITK